MGIGASLFLIAAGAILTFAVNANVTSDFNIHNAGVILMIIGAIGLVMSALIFGPRSRRTVVEDDTGRRITSTTRDGY